MSGGRHVLALEACTLTLRLYIEAIELGQWHVLPSAAHTLKLGLYMEPLKGLNASIELGLPSAMAHRTL